jgi:hypothetical protein
MVIQMLAARPRMGIPMEDRDPKYPELLICFGENGSIAGCRHGGQEVTVAAIRQQRGWTVKGRSPDRSTGMNQD